MAAVDSRSRRAGFMRGQPTLSPCSGPRLPAVRLDDGPRDGAQSGAEYETEGDAADDCTDDEANAGPKSDQRPHADEGASVRVLRLGQITASRRVSGERRAIYQYRCACATSPPVPSRTRALLPRFELAAHNQGRDESAE